MSSTQRAALPGLEEVFGKEGSEGAQETQKGLECPR